MNHGPRELVMAKEAKLIPALVENGSRRMHFFMDLPQRKREFSYPLSISRPFLFQSSHRTIALGKL